LELHAKVEEICITKEVGPNELRHLLDDAGSKSQEIMGLRSIYVSLDNKVLETYGWKDIVLEHGFHETKQGIRYTVSPAARQEVLDRLLELNHARYAEEVAAGLHKNKAKKGKTRSTGIDKHDMIGSI
jgi:hypothetical protein